MTGVQTCALPICSVSVIIETRLAPDTVDLHNVDAVIQSTPLLLTLTVADGMKYFLLLYSLCHMIVLLTFFCAISVMYTKMHTGRGTLYSIT